MGKRSNLLNTAFYLPDGKTSGIITVKDPMGQGFVQYFEQGKNHVRVMRLPSGS
jgi:hypothetical protein